MDVNTDSLLLGGIEGHVRLVLSRDSFCLIDPDSAYTVHITKSTLFIHWLTKKMRSKVTAEYPLTRVEMENVNLNSGVRGLISGLYR
ncbi:hypothetical protein TSAR_000786 [Trichomalopsis sarcophagae]|uniref:Uncharacterized protein n=1 Tax=Trichomalopsis sarcophagae TaxID=543379 RepID=A0A232FLX0_9HYME|nr:hypothetical protein TSAR_000786 [Trichomalopsis sarcophagae]